MILRLGDMNSDVSLDYQPAEGVFPRTVSIVTPSFNQGEFIEETICSVLSQAGEFFIDYIIMDGGSTDDSTDIIRKYDTLLSEHCETVERDNLKWYTRKDESFRWNGCLGISYRWISEKDRGQVDALKKGFRLAQGDIFCWLNSDDIYVAPDVLQKVCGYFQEESLQLLMGNGPFISKDGKQLKLHNAERINLKELIYLDYHILQPSTFFLKNIYDENKLDEGMVCAFDADFFIGLLCGGVNYKKVDDSFGAFRLYENNKTLGLTKTRIREQILITKKYSGSRYLTVVSTFYRRIQAMYESRFKGKKPFVWLWIILRRLCYAMTAVPRRNKLG
jgi:glycosyltransferase involved in cell wall biosynthesis